MKNGPNQNPEKPDPTKERILDRAESLFARKGFQAVSVREITTTAECNLAAVNYYFSNKENLYLEVFRSRWAPRARRIQQCYKDAVAAHRGPLTPQVLVRALAKAFVEGPLTDEERKVHLQLAQREFSQPTEAIKLLIADVQRPFFTEMVDSFRRVLPSEKDRETLVLEILSVFAMVMHFNFAREIVSWYTGRSYDTAFKARLVEHIVEFSLKGMGVCEEDRESP